MVKMDLKEIGQEGRLDYWLSTGPTSRLLWIW